MPSRFSFSASPEKIKRQFNLDIKTELQQSFNIGATQNAYVLTSESSELQILRWGLIPHWARDINVGTNLINAQAEGISGKLSFRLPLRQRRCLVLADSYYAWQKEIRTSQPYRIQLKNADIMAFAAVWDIWVDSDNQEYKTFSIITTTANKELQKLGLSEMPVLLNNITDQAKWLAQTPLPKLLQLLKPLEDDTLDYYMISKEIELLSNNYPDLHKPIQLIK